MAASIENCMVVRGWRVVSLGDAEGSALASLPPVELRGRIAPWVGADLPHGRLARIWANDAADGTINHFALHPTHTNNGQLSLIAATGGTLKSLPNVATQHLPPKISFDPKWPYKPLKPEQIATAPAGSAIVLVNVKGLSMSHGNGLIFARLGSAPTEHPAAIDHAPEAFSTFVGLLAAKSTGNMFAYALPPGRWRLQSVMHATMQLNYCLGSPAFELKAGDVLFAGTFDLGAKNFSPDLSLSPAKEWLGAVPAAASIRPASYVNGVRGICGPNAIYALEFDGVPFEPGYALGSKARAAQSGDSPTGAIR
jgi:hypothetical protein